MKTVMTASGAAELNRRVCRVALVASMFLAAPAVAQPPLPDSATPIRVRGKGIGPNIVGTLERVTSDSLTVRVHYTEYHGPRIADVIFYGAQRLLADPVKRRSAEGTIRTIARRDVRSVQTYAGQRRAPMIIVWTAPFAVIGAAGGSWMGPLGALTFGSLFGRVGYALGRSMSTVRPMSTWRPDCRLSPSCEDTPKLSTEERR
jgi:hypothetical protein